MATTTAAGRPAAPPEAKVLDPALAREASGEVSYSTGKDTSGAQRASVRAFNEQFADQGLSAKLLEFPESADQQRAQSSSAGGPGRASATSSIPT